MDYADHQNAQPASHLEYNIPTPDAAKVKQQAFAYMGQLIGWCSEQKAGILIDLILRSRPETIVEIGVWGGMSLVPMAHALKMNGKGKIYGIDPWSNVASLEEMANDANKAYWGEVNHEAVLHGLIYRTRQFDLENQIVLIRNTSA